jgi:hypothetical protein
MSSSPGEALKLKLYERSSGLTVMVGAILRLENSFSCSFACSFAFVTTPFARSRWIVLASAEASFCFVGVFIRSTSATSTPLATSCCVARRTSDDFP